MLSPDRKCRIIFAIIALFTFLSCTQDSEQSEIDRAFSRHESNVIVTGHGLIKKTLPDDLKGSAHQRFIVQIPSGRTVLIAHNIDIAQRIRDLQVGNRIRFRGEYEWNKKGGVVHWTHHDPEGRHQDGWIEYDGKRYE
jgi:hypothetical protein